MAGDLGHGQSRPPQWNTKPDHVISHSSKSYRPVLAAAAAVAATMLTASAAAGGVRIVAPEPAGGPQAPVETDQGYVTVSWQLDGAEDAADGRPEFVLEQSRRANFRASVVRYRGVDTASFLSGLDEGSHFFRVRMAATPGGWSEPLHVVVNYPPLSRVWLLMGVGAVCLAALVATILGGHFRMSRGAQTNQLRGG